MASIEIINEKKQKVGEVNLSDPLLSDKVNKAVLYQAVRATLSSRHHGTVDTKTRAEVNRTNKKVYRQKGTGGARHGSRKTSPFVGGGRVFGPHPRDYTIQLNKKVKQLAIREAIRSQLIDQNITILKEIPFKEIKTEKAHELFSGLNISSGLVVLDKPSAVIEKSIRNLKGFKIIRVDQLNTVDLLKYPKVIFTSESFEMTQKKYLS